MESVTLKCLTLALMVGTVAAVDWSYRWHTDPSQWQNSFPQCGGQKQSPINIQTNLVTPQRLRPLSFFDHRKNAAYRPMTLVNNGHCAQVDYTDKTKLPSIHVETLGYYSLAQFHFHWGSTNNAGSEHSINGKDFPMEMHLVHYNSKITGGFPKASNTKDGLLVIAFLFELSPYDNRELEYYLIHYFGGIEEPKSKRPIPSFAVNDILPLHYGRNYLSDYYLYSGSLTTPPCSESVIWVIAKQTIKISARQLRQFRTLEDKREGNLVDNIRPTQPINTRLVLSSA